MRVLRSVVLAPMLAIMVWAATVLASAAAPPPTAPTSGPVSPRLCADLMTGMKQWMSDPQSSAYLTPSQKHAIETDPLTGCVWRVTTDIKEVPVNSVPASARTGALINAEAVAPFCETKNVSYGIYDPIVAVPIMVGNTSTGWCSNGYSYMWLNWGPNCSTTTYPIYGTSITWCGWGRWATAYSSNGTCAPQSGMNWNYWFWSNPWWVRSGNYMRTQVFCTSYGGSITWGYVNDL